MQTPFLQESFISLSRWFAESKRDLSFRNNASIYQIWVSEVMLQQTTVNAVLPFYERFMDRFSLISDLAAAPLESVLELWSGLGYYSRAKNLHACAKIVLTQHNGIFPNTIKELLALPGIGDYTAGAILSFGYNLPKPLIDTNIARVISRLRGNKDLTRQKKRLWNTSSLLVHKALQYGIEPKVFNTAIMELGSLICKHNKALCEICPLQRSCKSHQLRLDPLSIPSPKVKVQKLELEERCFFITTEHKGRLYLLIAKDKNKRWLKDLWDLPTKIPSPLPILEEKLLTVCNIRYTITHHKIFRRVEVYKMDFHIIQQMIGDHFQLILLDDDKTIESLASTSALKKVIKKLKNLE